MITKHGLLFDKIKHKFMHALSSRRDSVDDNDKDFKKFYQKNEELNSPHTPKHTG
jgi:hypothetical protein